MLHGRHWLHEILTPGAAIQSLFFLQKRAAKLDALQLTLEDTARYAVLLLAPEERFGLWPRHYAYYMLIMLLWHILGHFWCPVVNLVTFSINLSNFERNLKKPKMGQNSIISSFFAQGAKKASAEGRSPLQELEVCSRSGLYLLVLVIWQLLCKDPI